MRKGLGINRGRGYFNLLPKDSYVHSLSAKGVKTYIPKHSYKKGFEDEGISDNLGKPKSFKYSKKFLKHWYTGCVKCGHSFNPELSSEPMKGRYVCPKCNTLNSKFISKVDGKRAKMGYDTADYSLKNEFRSLREEAKLLTTSDLQGRAGAIALNIAKKLNLKPSKVTPEGHKFYWDLENLLLEYAYGELDINSTKRFILDLPKDSNSLNAKSQFKKIPKNFSDAGYFDFFSDKTKYLNVGDIITKGYNSRYFWQVKKKSKDGYLLEHIKKER